MENTAGSKSPLQTAYCVHIRLDVLVVDDKTKKTLGRPWGTFIIDAGSGYPLGMHIGFELPSYKSVMSALRNAIKTKDYVVDDYPSLENDWLAYGVMSQLIIDNGKEFFSKHLQDTCKSIGIELVYSPPYRSSFKGEVERFFKQMNEQLTNKLPVVVERNATNKKDIAVKSSVLFLNELLEIIHLWLIDIYSVSFNKEIKAVPKVVWEDSIKHFSPKQYSPSNMDLDLLFGLKELRRIQQKGISLNRLLYNSNDLQSVIKECNRRKKENIVEVIYNTEDLSKICVYDKNNNSYIEVPCTNQQYSKNLSLAAHLIFLREALSQEKNVNNESLLRAKLKIQEIFSKNINKKF